MLQEHGQFNLLLALGAMFLLGLAADLLGRHSPLPRVTLLLLAGIAVGPSGFALLPADFVETWFPTLTHIALALVGFLLGQTLSLNNLRRQGRLVLFATFGETLGALLLVTGGLLLVGIDPVVALLLGGIATATAPAATFDVVHESGIQNEFTETLLSVVAVDDALALLWFTLMMAFAGSQNGDFGTGSTLAHGALEIGGSLLLGVLLGIPMAFLTGRIRKGEPTQAEAIGFVLLCGGLALSLGLSPVLSAMTMGAVVATLARHHKRPFHAIEGIEWPFMILFFILAGASAHLGAMLSLGMILGVYMVARCVGSYFGCRTGTMLAGAEPSYRRYLGLTLFPQAGVAIGMALLASQRFPEIGAIILPVILASTVLYEVLAPPVTRWALRRATTERPRVA
ncbi:MAG: cation:proton antiporter [Xanthomonadales bacterium]|nr:cation:proton antiporter [Xanthomonadales bacterium]